MENENYPATRTPPFLMALWRKLSGRGLEVPILLCVTLLIFLGGIWSAIFHLIALEQASAERAASESTRELVMTYEALMARALSSIDQPIKLVKYVYEGNDKKQPVLPELRAKELLPPALIFTIGIADRDGHIVESTQPGSFANIALQSSFKTHRENNTDTMFIDQPIHNSATGEWAIWFSRRLNAPDGSFAGVVVLAVSPDYFVSGYEQSRMGDYGTLGLLRADGIFLVKRIGDLVTWGEAVDYASITGGTGKEEDDQSVLRASPWDGVLRYINARQINVFPVTVIAGLSREEQLKAFNQQRRNYLWEAAIASVILILFFLVLSRLSWQLAKNRLHTRKVEETYYAASNASLDGVFILRGLRDAQGAITDFILDDTNRRVTDLTGMDKEALACKTLCGLLPQCRTNGVLDEFITVTRTGTIHEEEWQNRISSVRAEWLYRQIVRVEEGVVVIVRDISERKRVEAERQEMQSQLLGISRQAGMAEIATNVLHNVGNVLNSVNVSADLVSGKLRNSKALGLSKAVQLINEHSADLGDFLTNNEKGKLLPSYLSKLSEAVAAEQKSIIEELGHLTSSINHIKDIVATQQTYAGTPNLVEPLRIQVLIEDSLRMNTQSFSRHQITIVKEFADLPPLLLDKGRIVQILVNLISNAKHAMKNMGEGPHRLMLRTNLVDGQRLRVCVEDEGEGIPAENLTKIFTHGFTTRKEGHGFGLHSCALSAIEMGGTLTAHSDGPGKGAIFTLELPINV